MVFKSQLITSGSGNWTIPTGVKWIWVTLCGGGAGGGGGNQSTTFLSYEYAAGGGGGGGESVVNAPVPFLPTDTVIPYSVGDGGIGGIGMQDDVAGIGEDGFATYFGRIKAAGGQAWQGGTYYNGATLQSGTDCVYGAGGRGGGLLYGAGPNIGASNGSSPQDVQANFANGGAGAGSGGISSSNSGNGGAARYAGGTKGAYVNGQNTGGAGGGASFFGVGGDGGVGATCAKPATPSGYGGGGGGGASRKVANGAPGDGGDGAGGFILICWLE